MNRSSKIMVAMSGGVDSTVAAYLATQLTDAGNVRGVTGIMFEPGDAKACGGSDEARAACERLEISFDAVDCSDRFADEVIGKFVSSYLSGETPNPCVDCNRRIKFDALHTFREKEGFDYLATGHYARIDYDETAGRYRLLRSTHLGKDQSYFLYSMTQDQLTHTMFPLGGMSKDETRAIAAEQGFGNAEAPESQDICFVSDGDYVSFIRNWMATHACESCHRFMPFESGDIVDCSGGFLGRHSGLINYTIGQRKGIGVAGPEPYYVIGKDVENNRLIIGTRDELMTTEIKASDVNFVSIEEDAFGDVPARVRAKATYRQAPQPAAATYRDGILVVSFDEPIPKPSSGQAMVLYDFETSDIVLAGGTII